MFEQREDSPPLVPDMKTWVVKKEPPPLYIPLRKHQQPELSGHFVNVGVESNEVDGESYEVSEMTWKEDEKEDLAVREVRKDFLWPSKRKNSFYSFRPNHL